MPIIGDTLNIPISTVLDYSFLDSLVVYGYPVGGWEIGYRGTVYLKFTNGTGADITPLIWTEPYVDSYPPNPSATELITPGASTVLSLDLSGLTSDLTILKMNGDTGLILNEVRLIPFTVPPFWTSFKDQSETT
jgi:hypothetical protein